MSDRIVFMPGLDTQKVLGSQGTSRSAIEKKVVDWMEMLAGDGKGLIIDSTVAYSLNPANEQICLEFIQKHGKAFMDAKKAGAAYEPQYELGGDIFGTDDRSILCRPYSGEGVKLPLTHCLIAVSLHGQIWLADVGLGGNG